MEIESFKKEVLKEIASMSQETIIRALKGVPYLSDWKSLLQLEDYNKGEFGWMSELISAIISSFQMFQNYQQIISTPTFKQQTLALLGKYRPSKNDIFVDLYIKGIDDDTTRSLQVVKNGGELRVGDEVRIIDKNTAINEGDIEEVAIKLRDYFIDKFEDVAKAKIKKIEGKN